LWAYGEFQLVANMSGSIARKLKDLLKERDHIKQQVEISKERTTFAETKVTDKEKHIARIVNEAKQDLDMLKAELTKAIQHQHDMEIRLEHLENMDFVGHDSLICAALCSLLTLTSFRENCWSSNLFL
jgi:chromosome segregation ATPase